MESKFTKINSMIERLSSGGGLKMDGTRLDALDMIITVQQDQLNQMEKLITKLGLAIAVLEQIIKSITKDDQLKYMIRKFYEPIKEDHR